MSSLVIIMTFSDLQNLYIAKGRLETEGIECVIQDEYMVRERPEMGYTCHEAKLLTREEDAEKAIAILKEYGDLQKENKELPKLTESLNDANGRLPFLHQYPLQTKLLAVVFFILSVVIVVAVYRYGGLK